MKFGGISNARSFFLQFPDRPFDNMMQSYLRFACRLAILFYSMGVVAASELTRLRGLEEFVELEPLIFMDRGQKVGTTRFGSIL